MDRRLQVLIDRARWSRLERAASRRGVAVLVREAIDQQIPQNVEELRSALQAILDAEPMSVLDPVPLREELDQIRGRGLG
ncbi:MAG: antitoxin [Candidatus Dormiibacterota bacterium]